MMKKIVFALLTSSVGLLAFDGAKVYKQCTMCHGKHGEKVAMNSSPKLHTLSEADLSSRLHAIADGSSKMASKYLGMHKAKLKKVSSEEMPQLAAYIKGL